MKNEAQMRDGRRRQMQASQSDAKRVYERLKVDM